MANTWPKAKGQGGKKAGGKEIGIKIKVGDCEFGSLYVEAKYLDYEVLKTITDLAEDGLPVCLKGRPEEAGQMKHADFDILAERLIELSSPDWATLLKTKPLVSGDDLPYFWCRKDGNKYYIFFANPVAKDFKYPVAYGQADTSETVYRKVTVTVNGKSAEINLAFKPYESLMLEMESNGRYRFISLPTVN